MSRGNCLVREVRGLADMSLFVRLGEIVNRDQEAFVPPLRLERQMAFCSWTNPWFRHASAAFFLCFRDGLPAGRASVQDCRLYRERHDPGGIHFGSFLAIDDPEVFAALDGAICRWARERNGKRLSGPYELSIHQPLGVLVEGFDTPPVVMGTYNPPWTGPRLEALGYRKKRDLLSFVVGNPREVDGQASQAGGRMAQMVRRTRSSALESGEVSTRPLARNMADIRRALDFYNGNWRDTWEFVPMTAAERDSAARMLWLLLWPGTCQVAERKGEVVGLVIAIPDLAWLTRDFGGRLTPVTLFRLVRRLREKPVRRWRFLLGGVSRELGSLLAGRLYTHLIASSAREIWALGGEFIDASWIEERNTVPLTLLGRLGRQYKRHRIYERELQGTPAGTESG